MVNKYMKTLLSALTFLLGSCLCQADEPIDKDLKLWLNSVKVLSTDERIFCFGECKLFIKKGTIINNSGSLLRVYPKGGSVKSLVEKISGSKSFLDEIKNLTFEKEKWFPLRGGDSIVFHDDMVITVNARKSGVMKIVSKVGGYPILVMGSVID